MDTSCERLIFLPFQWEVRVPFSGFMDRGPACTRRPRGRCGSGTPRKRAAATHRERRCDIRCLCKGDSIITMETSCERLIFLPFHWGTIEFAYLSPASWIVVPLVHAAPGGGVEVGRPERGLQRHIEKEGRSAQRWEI